MRLTVFVALLLAGCGGSEAQCDCFCECTDESEAFANAFCDPDDAGACCQTACDEACGQQTGGGAISSEATCLDEPVPTGT